MSIEQSKKNEVADDILYLTEWQVELLYKEINEAIILLVALTEEKLADAKGMSVDNIDNDLDRRHAEAAAKLAKLKALKNRYVVYKKLSDDRIEYGKTFRAEMEMYAFHDEVEYTLIQEVIGSEHKMGDIVTIDSPIGLEARGKKVGDSFTIIGGRGDKINFKILEVTDFIPPMLAQTISKQAADEKEHEKNR